MATSDTVASAAAIQASGSRASDQEGLRQVVRNVMRESGPWGFYAGFLPTLMRSVPRFVNPLSLHESSEGDRISVCEEKLTHRIVQLS